MGRNRRENATRGERRALDPDLGVFPSPPPRRPEPGAPRWPRRPWVAPGHPPGGSDKAEATGPGLREGHAQGRSSRAASGCLGVTCYLFPVRQEARWSRGGQGGWGLGGGDRCAGSRDHGGRSGGLPAQAPMAPARGPADRPEASRCWGAARQGTNPWGCRGIWGWSGQRREESQRDGVGGRGRAGGAEGQRGAEGRG